MYVLPEARGTKVELFDAAICVREAGRAREGNSTGQNRRSRSGGQASARAFPRPTLIPPNRVQSSAAILHGAPRDLALSVHRGCAARVLPCDARVVDAHALVSAQEEGEGVEEGGGAARPPRSAGAVGTHCDRPDAGAARGQLGDRARVPLRADPLRGRAGAGGAAAGRGAPPLASRHDGNWPLLCADARGGAHVLARALRRVSAAGRRRRGRAAPPHATLRRARAHPKYRQRRRRRRLHLDGPQGEDGSGAHHGARLGGAGVARPRAAPRAPLLVGRLTA
eukprot:314217-Pleurochrysis_carterae.AAC.1